MMPSVRRTTTDMRDELEAVPFPGAFAGPGGHPLPAMKTMVEIRVEDAAAPLVAYSRIVGREPGFDFLDALRGPNGRVLASPDLVGRRAILSFGDDARWFLVPVEIAEMLDPLPLLKIRYRGDVQSAERRRASRTPAAARGTLRFVDGRGFRECSCVTRDISPGGVRVVLNEAIAVGQAVRARLALSPSGEFEAWGTVIRVATAATRAGDRGRHDVVVQWDPAWSDEEAARWMGFCAAERWAGRA